MERVWLVSYGMAWLLAAAQALTVVALFWALGRINLKRAPEAHALITDEGPEIHTALPGFEGRDTTGRRILTSDYRGRELALLLVSPGCAPCDQVARAIAPTRTDRDDPPEFLVVMAASRAEAVAYRQGQRLDCPVIADEVGAIRARLQVERTPYGFLVDGQGVIRMKGVVNDRWQLEGLTGRRGQRLGGRSWEGVTTGPEAPVAMPEAEAA